MPTPLAEARRLLILAAPVALAQVGIMMLGVVDMLMVSRIGKEAVDAIALGNVWTFGTLIFGMGVVFGIDPLVSQSHGAGDAPRMGRAVQTGLLVAVIVSVPVIVAWGLTEPALLLWKQDEVLAASAHRYALVQIPGVAPFLMYMVLRQYLIGREITAPVAIVILVSNLINAGANWIFIFGHFGVPAMGVEGAGIATAITRVLQFVLTAGWIYVARLHQGAWAPWSRTAFSFARLGEVFRHGLPVGLQYGLEVWCFQISTLMAGWLGKVSLAAHAIVFNIVALSFMVPMGISFAAVARVGKLVGAREPEGAQRAAWVALGIAVTWAAISATVLITLRHALPSLYRAEPSVLAVCAGLLPIAAAFQIFDGTQVVGGGVLRGMGRTVPAAVFNIAGYYVVGLPLAYLLAFRADWGIRGVWWGLFLGLATVSVCLIAWIYFYGPARAARLAAHEATTP